jgi:hypothetical protein
MRNYQKVISLFLLAFIFLVGMESCGGSKGMGSGKQKKNCNCGF